MSKIRTKEIDRFFEAILTLENVEECYSFFEDVCTVKEMNDMAQRLFVAELLSAGKNYSQISLLTGSSTATISRVSKCLSYGTQGYQLILDRLNDRNNGGSDDE